MHFYELALISVLFLTGIDWYVCCLEVLDTDEFNVIAFLLSQITQENKKEKIKHSFHVLDTSSHHQVSLSLNIYIPGTKVGLVDHKWLK